MSTSFCADSEGWGPTSTLRPDLTPCVENTILLGLSSLVAIVAFAYRTIQLKNHGTLHGLGRTNLIYWPSQLCMAAGSIALIARAVQLGQDPASAPATMFATVALALAWWFGLVLNHFEHQYEIRSSSFIYLFYVISVVASAISIRTMTLLSQTSESQFLSFVIFFGFIVVGFLIEAYPRNRTLVQKNSGQGAFAKASLGSRLTFQYLQPIVSTGYKRPLTAKDIVNLLPEEIKTKHGYPRLANYWNNVVAKYNAKVTIATASGTKAPAPPSLFKTIFLCYKLDWVPILLLETSSSALTYVSPALLNNILAFLATYQTDKPQPVELGIILAFGLFIAAMCNSMVSAMKMQMEMNFGLQVRTALIHMVYRKALRLSPSARAKSTAGMISNHMSVDSEKWNTSATTIPFAYSIPLELSIALWMLYGQLGWTVFVGFGVLLASMPLNAYMGKYFGQAQRARLGAMDNRMRLMNEVLSSIKTIKLYNWESSFMSKVAHFRDLELATLKRNGIVFTFMSIMLTALPLLIFLSSFAVYATVGGPNFTPGDINAQVVFVSISIFALMTRPIGLLAFLIADLANLRVATERLSKFMIAEEIDPTNVNKIKDLPKGDDFQVPIIAIEDGLFAWENEIPETEQERADRIKAADKKHNDAVALATKLNKPAPEREIEVPKDYSPTLIDINFSIRRGHLTAVMGKVGCGKSSLLNALIGDMYVRRGKVTVYGHVAYVPQQAWITNATMKDNIVFGNVFDQTKYDQIVAACGLVPDIAMLPAGDMTEIGERGINLSGGQKQRVSLARAVYEDADVYLLDDPLSAVDAHVDQHLWQNVIGPNGLLNQKTRVMVTHGINHLDQVDQIIVLKDGSISETGQYEQLMAAGNAFKQLIHEFAVNQGKARKVTSEVEESDTATIAPSPSAAVVSTVPAKVADAAVNKSPASAASVPPATDKKKDDKGALVKAEKGNQGAISWKVYDMYCRAVSYRYTIAALALYIAAQACQIATNVWLTYWTNNVGRDSLGKFLGVYAALVVVYVFLYVFVYYVMMVVAAIRASKTLHELLLSKVLHLSMSFFDQTPLGRIVNRFSADMVSVDEVLPMNFASTLRYGISVIGTIIVIASSTPIFLAVLPPLIGAYLVVQTYFVCSSRALKRIESASKSPIYAHFGETLLGVSSIRAMGNQQRFIDESATKAETSANAYFAWVQNNRWLQLRLDFLGALVVLSSALFAVLARSSINASIAGLSLSYAMSITLDCTWLLKTTNNLQNQLVSIERVDEYIHKNPEAPAKTDADVYATEKNWPTQGTIEFRNYSTRYREGLDLVIQDVSFSVAAGEKIGIVGRTGAGKSSLTLALFRIIEAANSHWAKASENDPDFDATTATTPDPKKSSTAAAEVTELDNSLQPVNAKEIDGGSIWIDGIDISTLGLDKLRQHLTIIPQDPTLFAGSVRDNLDPFNDLQDADLWQALERAHLKDYVSSLAGGLQYKVTPQGDNFSSGQRQLLSLARALLRKSKILVLDEATSATDVETDSLIQQTIRTEFKDRTILTIAHRLKTVMDSDKILVLEKGRVEEFQTPAILLQNKDSLFYKLAEQSGEIKNNEDDEE